MLFESLCVDNSGRVMYKILQMKIIEMKEVNNCDVNHRVKNKQKLKLIARDPLMNIHHINSVLYKQSVNEPYLVISSQIYCKDVLFSGIITNSVW